MKQNSLLLWLRVSRPMRAPPSKSTPRNVMLWFSATDLRLHDHYALILAARKSCEIGSRLYPVFVYDPRCLSAASETAGFFRAHPRRAMFLNECVEDVRNSFRDLHGSPMWVRVGSPETVIPKLAQELDCSHVFCHTLCSPHEEHVQQHVREALATSGANLMTVWGSTVVHMDDLPTTPESMDTSFRLYWDTFSVARIRPTEPYDGRRRGIFTPAYGTEVERVPVGNLPTLPELGYRDEATRLGGLYKFRSESAQVLNFFGGEQEASKRVETFFDSDGLGRIKAQGSYRVRSKMFGHEEASRLSPYLAHGCLSPRRLYELTRIYTIDNLPNYDAQGRLMMYRLAQRDYWYFMGKKFGNRLYARSGPDPEYSAKPIPDGGWRFDPLIVRRWCAGVTGMPFVDACARELQTTGYLEARGRQALIWYLVCALHQDWRIAAEWLERNLLDYDPHLCWGNTAYYAGLLFDVGGEAVLSSDKLANMCDTSGRYVRLWVPELHNVPTVYIHRVQVLTPRMQEMHGTRLGIDYPHPMKLWVGAESDPATLSKLKSFVGDEKIYALGEGRERGIGQIPRIPDKQLLTAPNPSLLAPEHETPLSSVSA